MVLLDYQLGLQEKSSLLFYSLKKQNKTKINIRNMNYSVC